MKIPLNRLVPVLAAALVIAAGLAAQERMPTDEDPIKRLFPKSANPDGTFKCAPPCGPLEPCC